MRSVPRGSVPESRHPEIIHKDVKRSVRSLPGIGFFSAAREATGTRRKATRHTGQQKRPKLKLGLPHLDHCKAAVLNSLRSTDSKRRYRHAVDKFIAWYSSEPRLLSSKVVTRHRIPLEERGKHPISTRRRNRRVRCRH